MRYIKLENIEFFVFFYLSGARMRFFKEPSQPDVEITPQSCREFIIPENHKNWTLYYDCLWNDYKYESSTYHFQYIATARDETQYLYKYVFRVPSHLKRGQINCSFYLVYIMLILHFLNILY